MSHGDVWELINEICDGHPLNDVKTSACQRDECVPYKGHHIPGSPPATREATKPRTQKLMPMIKTTFRP